MDNHFKNQIKNLLNAVSEQGEAHLYAVSNDLLQTQFLLNAAITQLSESFLNVNQVISAQQALINDLPNNNVSTEVKDALHVLKTKITHEVNLAVTALQFQDMTNQLIENSIKRTDGLKALLAGLGSHGSTMQEEHEYAEMMHRLKDIQQSFHQHSQALTGDLRKVVVQNNILSGEVELF